MATALKSYNPEFEISKPGEYLPSIIANYRFSLRQTPSAVIADFNGDGKLDAALTGHDKQNYISLVLVSSGTEYTAIEESKTPYYNPHTVSYDDETGLYSYLQIPLNPKTAADSGYCVLDLTGDAFLAVIYEKTQSLIYFKKGKPQIYVEN